MFCGWLWDSLLNNMLDCIHLNVLFENEYWIRFWEYNLFVSVGDSLSWIFE